MQDVMGVINLSEEEDCLEELTNFRNHSSVPFGGRYRLIDFALSNMVNSGIRDIAVIPSRKYRSLMDHLGTGRDWDLDRRRGGLFIFPPTYNLSLKKIGDINSYFQHIDFFIRGNQNYVIISNGNIVSNIDYRPAFHFHLQHDADITLFYTFQREGRVTTSSLRKLSIGDGDRVIAIMEKSSFYNSNKLYIETLIINKSILQRLIENGIINNESSLIEDSIINNLSKLNIYGFPYHGYLANIDSVQSYYLHSMELLDRDIWNELFYKSRLIYSKVKNEPPIKYSETAKVKNSLLANGCIIEGSVENSILFRGVRVNKGATIRNSIVMQKSIIGENAIIENSILDKRVNISKGATVRGAKNKPFVVAKRCSI